MNNEREKEIEVEDLVIAAKFPPVTSTSGLVFAKRILNNKRPVDVVQGKFSGSLDHDFNEVLDEYIENRMVIDINPYSDTANTSDKFRTDGISRIEELNNDYKNIHTRCFPTTNNFLAFEYKARHPSVNWIAEFSDPILVNLENKPRGQSKSYYYKNEEFINLINSKINKVNNESEIKFDLIEMEDNVFFIAEYLAYLFADKIIFTNPNQREVMLSYYSDDFKDFVMKKSIIEAHPTLSQEYYHIKEYGYDVDESRINLAYFGTYLAKRNFETIFYALDSLNGDLKHKVKFHLFMSKADCKYLERIIADLDIREDIILNERLSQFEFLNVSTKFDVLIVNDSLTKGIFKVNPFLPSKVSDYLGSGKEIWAICEEGSILESLDEVRYKSYIDDYQSSRQTLNRIIEDKLSQNINDLSPSEEIDDLSQNIDDLSPSEEIDDLSQNINDLSQIEELNDEIDYLKNRLNYLNQIVPKKDQTAIIKKKDKEIKKLKSENKKLKNKNKEILNSNSWKLTKAFRKPKKLLKKD